MDPSDHELFRQVFLALVQDLEPDKVLGHLLLALTGEDIEIIRAQNTRNKQVNKLLDILKRRSRGLELLAKALLLSRVQDFLAFEILKKSTWSEEKISSLVGEQLSEDQRSRIKVLIEQRRQEAATRHPQGPQENPSESRGAAALPREEGGERQLESAGLRRRLEDSEMSGVEEEGSLPTGMQETSSEQTQTTQVNSLTEIQRGIEELTVTNEPIGSGQAEAAVLTTRKLKRLRDLNLDTCNKVAMYLSNPPVGTGGWSEIAEKYGMKKINIRDIERTQGQRNPGKEVIEYLSAAVPALTVREFRCVLRHVRRRDIVELLECHIYENSEPANQRTQ